MKINVSIASFYELRPQKATQPEAKNAKIAAGFRPPAALRLFETPWTDKHNGMDAFIYSRTVAKMADRLSCLKARK